MISVRSECTACFACKQICPTKAISMSYDENGFMIPYVKIDKCISCGLCDKVCPIDAELLKKNQRLFSFINKDSEKLLNSSSGGFFAAAADWIINQNGVVFGCVLDNNLKAVHKCGSTQADIKNMQGSKYVQSYIGESFKETEDYLKKGIIVLFTGTPCQIHGLYRYLKNDYSNLYTIDIICHGVPNQEMLDHELAKKETASGQKIRSVSFRDKTINGWNLIGSVKQGNKKKVFFPANSPYYHFFDTGRIYRDCCYSCKYANMDRVSDITIGDFWGIENTRIEKSSTIAKGVSLVITNTPKGLTLFEDISNKGFVSEQRIEIALAENMQLQRPVPIKNRDEELIRLFHDNKMKEINDRYRKELRFKRAIKALKAFVPIRYKIWIKRLWKDGQ